MNKCLLFSTTENGRLLLSSTKGQEERKVKSSMPGTAQVPKARVAKEPLLNEGHLHSLPKQPCLRLLSLATGRNLSHSPVNTEVQKFYCKTAILSLQRNHFFLN